VEFSAVRNPNNEIGVVFILDDFLEELGLGSLHNFSVLKSL